ncbi:MAG TPA: galactokinase [Opitutus sp.]|nr:galactokinase [Opitutus sp.]
MADLREKLRSEFAAAFGREPAFVARAPGRIEFIGNHTDYNGGTVLGAAIDRGVWVGVAPRADGRRRFASDQRGRSVEVPAGEAARQVGAAAWVNYPLGVIAALAEFGLNPPGGFDFLALSDLPAGAGLSSSAAIELASALAFLALTRQDPPRETLVKIGRWAENHFVGVPCGILDQGVSGFGEEGRLVFIDCRGPRFATVPLPAGAHFWLFNTHTKHALIDGLYAERHRECMASAQALGVACLADLRPEQLDAAAAKLPEPAARRTRHVVGEIARVEATMAALRADDLAEVGKLLTASHASSRTLFENSTLELDALVDALGKMKDVFGARLTGGGFGGAVMALTNARFDEAAAKEVVTTYQKLFGTAPDVLHAQTGAGAALVT